MSSTPTTSGDAPSSRVQSASNKAKEEISIENTNLTKEKTSRPPSAADTSRAPVIAATGAGISSDAPAAGREEPISLTVTSSERPPSANKQTTTELRPGSASKNVSQDTIIRPSSAANVASTQNPVLNSTTTEPKTSRPSSANQKTDDLVSHGYSIATTTFRPPSASQKTDESAANNSTITPTGSRPSSANQKSNESNTNNSNIVPTNSRSSTASQKTDVTNLGDSNTTTVPTNSRPSSANQKTDLTTAQTNSRPPSANRKTTNDSTIEQQDTSNLFDLNDSNITQPIIGRPPSAAKKTSTDESDTISTLDASAPLITLTENTPSSDENNS